MGRWTRRIAVLSMWIAGLAAVPGAAWAQEPDASVTEVATAPVSLDGDVLFSVRGVSTLPAQTRATRIQERLAAIAADASIDPASLHAVPADNGTNIVAGDRPIMTIVAADANLEQVEHAVLAEAYVTRLREAVAHYREARSASALRRSALTAAGATLVFALAVVLVFLAWRRLDRLLLQRLQARIQSVEIQSCEVMRRERIWGAIRGISVAFRTVVLLALALVYLGRVLSHFPWTRGFSRNMADLALSPLKVIGWGLLQNLPSLVFLVVLYVLVRLTLRLVHLFFDEVHAGKVAMAGFDRTWAQPTYKLIRLAIVAFALVVGYPYIPGSGSEAFKGISLFIGIVFSLGSSSAISNIIAGYLITYRRAFKVGDRIRVGDAMGDVIETRLQVTHLRSVKNEELIIPNSQILSVDVVNYSSLAETQGLILHTEVGIGYETPWRQVEAMLVMAAERTSGLAPEPAPFVLEKSLGDFAVTYELNVYTRTASVMARMYAELHRNILDVFNEYGVQIMTPAYEGDPAEPKVVARKDWYMSPANPGKVAAPSPRDHTVAS